MKTIKCKKCGTEYPKRLKKCPQCKTKTPMPPAAIIAIIICCIGIGACIGTIPSTVSDGSGSGSGSSSSSPTATQTNNENSKTESTKSDSKVIYTDSDLKITYNKIADGKDLGVTACYIYLKVENLSSQTINVTLTDAYANDTAVTVMSGLPMKLAPGKNSQQPFLFGYNEIFTSADDVEKLEFKVSLYNESFTEVVKTTESITVQVK